MNLRNRRPITATFLVAATAGAFFLRYGILAQNPYPCGFDGYYYIKQITALVKTGAFRCFENSLIVYAMAFIHQLIGDPVRAVKITTALFTCAAVPIGFFYVRLLTKSTRAAVFFACWMALSPSLSYLSAQFPKNAAATTLLLLFLLSLEFRAKKRNLTSVIFLAGSFLVLLFSHKLALAAGILVAAGYTLRSLEIRRSLILTVGGGLGVLAVMIISKSLLFQDIHRVLPQLNTVPVFPLTAVARSVRLHPVLQFEILISTGSLFLALLAWRSLVSKTLIASMMILIVLFFNPFYRFNGMDLGYRLMLFTFVPGAIILSVLAARRMNLWLRFAPFLLLLAFGLKATAGYDPAFDQAQNQVYARVVDQIRKRDFLILIAHQGLNFYYDCATGRDALAYRPDKNGYPAVFTWRLAWGITYDAYQAILPPGYEKRYPAVEMLIDRYSLVREDLWQLFLARINDNLYLKDIAISWRNPYEEKPSFVAARDNSTTEYVNIQQRDPSIAVELRYATRDNFLHDAVYGDLGVCLLNPDCAAMLQKARALLQARRPGCRFLIFDGLRSRSIQRSMWELVKGTEQQKYVARPFSGSLHNYGAAVDLTIIDDAGTALDMGTPFDAFLPLSEPAREQLFLAGGTLTEQQWLNRKLLRDVMCEAGFVNSPIEWWHFSQCRLEEAKRKYRGIE